MSKKTFFKRIAVTAIAAMGFGVVSVQPSNAIVGGTTLSWDADDAILTGESATATLTFTLDATSASDSAVVRVNLLSGSAAGFTSIYMLPGESRTNLTTTTGNSGTSPILLHGSLADPGPSAAALSSTFTGAGVASTGASTGYGLGNTGYTQANLDSSTVVMNASGASIATVKYTVGLYNAVTAGTYVIRAQSFTRNASGGLVGGVTASWTVTVTAADTKASSSSSVSIRTGNAADSGVFWGGTREGLDSTTTALRSSTSTSTAPEFSAIVFQRSAGATNIARESFTVTVSGEAYVTTASGTRPNINNGVKSLRFASAVAGTGNEVWLWSTGTSGTATVTVTSDSGLVLGTKTLTFHGLVTKIAVQSVQKKIIRAGTTAAQTDAVRILATDSAGRGVTGVTGWSSLTSNSGAITSASCSEDVTLGTGIYSCAITPAATSVSGAAATVTIRVVDPSVTTSTAYLTVDQAFTMGGAVSTVVLTTDKANYEPGEYMKITATAKDSSGNAPYDGQAGPTLAANKSLGSSSISMNTYLGGVSTSDTRDSDDVNTILNSKNLFAPAASGKFTVSGVDGLGAAISVTATVSDDAATAAAAAATDAALEAIDAANAATDAANLAAEAADAATVAAEEARDAADAATAAVEALATEVATLMAALKAQITTLANTVAKIAKKVKA